MITEEQINEKLCLFCASDYHLEMILLPYIKNRLDNSNFVIFTENSLEKTLEILLTKINIDEESKKKIKNINWNNNDRIKYKQLEENKDKDIYIIINGELNYIKTIDNNIKNFINKGYRVVHCYHVGDTNINIDEISKEYDYVLNTKKIE